jgi:hypothetical protein
MGAAGAVPPNAGAFPPSTSGAGAARLILLVPEPAAVPARRPGVATPPWVRAMAAALAVLVVALVAAGVYAAIF